MHSMQARPDSTLTFRRKSRVRSLRSRLLGAGGAGSSAVKRRRCRFRSLATTDWVSGIGRAPARGCTLIEGFA